MSAVENLNASHCNISTWKGKERLRLIDVLFKFLPELSLKCNPPRPERTDEVVLELIVVFNG